MGLIFAVAHEHEDISHLSAIERKASSLPGLLLMTTSSHFLWLGGLWQTGGDSPVDYERQYLKEAEKRLVN
jgi:hypothetical protein